MTFSKDDRTFIQFFRYTIVGGLAFIVDFGLLYILTEWCGILYLKSACISFVAGLTINYVLSKHYVFSYSTVNNHLLEFGIFALIGIIGLFFTELFMWLFTSILNFYYMLSKATTTVIVYLWNFLARKYILFNKKTQK